MPSPISQSVSPSTRHPVLPGDIVLQAMAPSGVELIVGIRNEVNFGSFVIVGPGGVLVELANQVLGAGHPLLVEASGIDVAGALAGVPGLQKVTPEGEGAWRVVADRDVRAAVAQRIVSSGGALTRLADLQPSLEEVYTRYFQLEVRHAA